MCLCISISIYFRKWSRKDNFFFLHVQYGTFNVMIEAYVQYMYSVDWYMLLYVYIDASFHILWMFTWRRMFIDKSWKHLLSEIETLELCIFIFDYLYCVIYHLSLSLITSICIYIVFICIWCIFILYLCILAYMHVLTYFGHIY